MSQIGPRIYGITHVHVPANNHACPPPPPPFPFIWDFFFFFFEWTLHNFNFVLWSDMHKKEQISIILRAQILIIQLSNCRSPTSFYMPFFIYIQVKMSTSQHNIHPKSRLNFVVSSDRVFNHRLSAMSKEPPNYLNLNPRYAAEIFSNSKSGRTSASYDSDRHTLRNIQRIVKEVYRSTANDVAPQKLRQRFRRKASEVKPTSTPEVIKRTTHSTQSNNDEKKAVNAVKTVNHYWWFHIYYQNIHIYYQNIHHSCNCNNTYYKKECEGADFCCPHNKQSYCQIFQKDHWGITSHETYHSPSWEAANSYNKSNNEKCNHRCRGDLKEKCIHHSRGDLREKCIHRCRSDLKEKCIHRCRGDLKEKCIHRCRGDLKE